MTRILVVDDKPANVYPLRVVLEGHGFDVVEARNGVEALAKARETPPQLIISDLLMPVMDGYTLLRRWKADEQHRRIPFVVCTATYTEPNDERFALDLGADAFIIKPTEAEPFLARIREVLAKSKRGELAPTRVPAVEDKELLNEYNEVLIHKLEEKTSQLEQTNRDLAAREARLRAIFENEPECVKLLAADGSVLEMNPAGLRIVEADSLAQVKNQCMDSLVVEEHRAAFRELTARVFRGESGTLEFRIVGLRGGRCRLETHASPLRDATGAVTALLGITRDITERKRAEEALREALDQLAKIVATTPGAVCSFRMRPDGSSCFTYGAERIEEMCGIPPRTLAEDASAIFRMTIWRACKKRLRNPDAP